MQLIKYKGIPHQIQSGRPVRLLLFVIICLISTGFSADTIYLNQSLNAGDSLYDTDRKFAFRVQSEGNCVLYNKQKDTVLWVTGRTAGRHLDLESDGNLVFRTPAGEILWETKTAGKGVTRLHLDGNGNLQLLAGDKVIYSLYSTSKNVPQGLDADPQKGEWTFIVIPDSQNYAESGGDYDFSKLKNTYEWIVSVRDRLNVKFVQHVGDMVNHNNTTEWNREKQCYDLLDDNNIPYAPCGGNHESYDGYKMLNRYFPPAKFQDNSWWGGHLNGIQNSYQRFDFYNEKYLFITLEYQPGYGATVDWAENLVNTHPDRKVIFTSHWNNGQAHYKQIIGVKPNVILSLAGHKCAEEHYVGANGSHSFVQDYQCADGKMNVRYFKFKPLEDKVQWFTYSAVLQEWETDAHSQGSWRLVQKDPDTTEVTPTPPPTPMDIQAVLPANSKLTINQILMSPNNSYRLIFQSDGNLVLRDDTGSALWSSGSHGKGGKYVAMQGDGNLVIYADSGAAVWSSKTAGEGAVKLTINDNGNILLEKENGDVVWGKPGVVKPTPTPAPTPLPPTPTPQESDTLLINENMYADSYLVSANGQNRLIFQGDGNLVLKNTSGNVLWSSGTHNQDADGVRLQGDGNLVIYTGDGKALWSSKTENAGVTRLIVTDSATIVLQKENNDIVWHKPEGPLPTATPLPPTPTPIGIDTLRAGEIMTAGDKLVSQNNEYSLNFQGDGNLVLRNNAGASKWSSGSHGKGGTEVKLQGDGNLVIYAGTGKAVWSSSTERLGAVKLVLKNSGELQLNKGDGTSVWKVNAMTPSGPLTDKTFLKFEDANGITSSYHRYAAGLDWNKRVGLLIYTDGSGEYGLKNPGSSYLLAGANGLIKVAKQNNMILLTPLAPGAGCPDGDGTCWYQTSSGFNSLQKARWSANLVSYIQKQYKIDKSRVAFGGYSSGAQWTTEFFGPAFASGIMTDGVAVAISYGGTPKVALNFSSEFKNQVPFLWDVGKNDDAYNTGKYGALGGYNWYKNNGFMTELNAIPGLGHNRSGQFGDIMDRAIKKHVPAP